MKKGTKVKKAFSFAHLIGISAARADDDQDDAADDKDGKDDERKQRDDESDEDYAERMEELDKKEADDEDPDPDADDDDESEKEKAARASERARCATIFGSKAAASRPDFAAHLAFETNLSAKQAVGMLSAFAAGAPAGAAKPKSLGNRMAGVKVPNVGASADAAAAPNATQAAADAIIAAGRARRGEK